MTICCAARSIARGARLRAVLVLVLAYAASAEADPYQAMEELLENGRYNEAAEIEGPRLVRDRPTDAEAHFLFAKALYYSGRTAGAQATLEQAAVIAAGANDPRRDWLRGLIAAEQTDLARAEQLLKAAFHAAHEYYMAMDWGRIAWQHGNFEAALLAFELAAGTEQGAYRPWSYLHRARLLIALDRHDEAKRVLSDALPLLVAGATGDGLEISLARVEANYLLGSVHETLGDYDAAHGYYHEALGLDGDYLPARHALERLQRQR